MIKIGFVDDFLSLYFHPVKTAKKFVRFKPHHPFIFVLILSGIMGWFNNLSLYIKKVSLFTFVTDFVLYAVVGLALFMVVIFVYIMLGHLFGVTKYETKELFYYISLLFPMFAFGFVVKKLLALTAMNFWIFIGGAFFGFVLLYLVILLFLGIKNLFKLEDTKALFVAAIPFYIVYVLGLLNAAFVIV